MKIKNLLLMLTTLSPQIMHGVVQTNLPETVISKVFDRSSGTLYLGLNGGANNAITKFYRFDGSGTPASTAVATDIKLSGSTIEFLALSEQGCQNPPLLATVTEASAGTLQQTFVSALTSDGKTVTSSIGLNDASGTHITNGIVGLAASSDLIFAAVRPNGGDFGAASSGIALIATDTNTLALEAQDATTGIAGNKAQLFDLTSAALKINPLNNVTFDAPANDNIHLYYDSLLNRLYLATHITAGVGGARSTAVAYVDDNGILQIKQLAPNGAFNNSNTQIIGTTNAVTAHAYNVRVLHASTGPSYLIVNGEVNVATNGTNHIYALPLVDDPSIAATHGTLADVDAALVDGKFVTPAAAASDLAVNTDDAAMVGTGPLPIPTTNIPYDIVVVGDTVYASSDEPYGVTSESGIFYSQALFDEEGKIARWTPWTKRATPFNSFPDATTNEYPRVSFFDVDAMNGKLWAVDAVVTQTLMSTAWDFGSDVSQTTPHSLVANLNKALTAGCYSILDLDQSTRGFDPATSCDARYTLFGGVDKVVFAFVSLASTGAPFTQQVFNNFSDPSFFKDSALPSGAGAVVALEYSRRLTGEGEQNYFFAGTQNGLYVFADATTGRGFTISPAIDLLDAPPFSTGKWYQIDTDLIQGSVIALKTTGQGSFGALYILTLESTTNPTQPLISRLYSMIYDTTVDLMNQESHINLLAQSQVAATNSNLTNVKIILGMQNITQQANGYEQLVIATNNGLYRSTAAEAIGSTGILSATNQATALWTPVDATDTALYTGLFGIDNALFQSTMWALQIADEAQLKTFARSNVRQLSGITTANGYTFLPDPFNSSDVTAANATTLAQSTFFWSDGARRFFIARRNGDNFGRNRLMVFPYDQDEWCASTLYVLDAALNNICACNCIKQLGATGILAVGTNSGVVALE